MPGRVGVPGRRGRGRRVRGARGRSAGRRETARSLRTEPARRGSSTRRPESSCSPTPSCCPGRDGSPPRSCRSASTPVSTCARAAPLATPPRRGGDHGGRLDRPARGARRHAAGELSLVFPTIKHLESLLPYSSAEEVLAAAGGRRIEPIMPRVVGEGKDNAWSCPASRDTEATATLPAGGPGRLRALRHHRVHHHRRPPAADRLAGDAVLRPELQRSTPSTGLGYPKKANDARRNPRVAMLFPDSTGSGIEDRHPGAGPGHRRG